LTPFAAEIERLSQRRAPPTLGASVDLAVGEKRIHGDAFIALFRHHVHRIVQHHLAQLPRRFRHKNGSASLGAQEYRQRSDVVLVCVRKDDRVGCVVAEQSLIGKCRLSFQLWMHAGIEDQSFATQVMA
jgi:hypothetical protein